DVPARPGAGVERAVGGQCQAEDLAVAAGMDDAGLAVGRDLEELALVAGGHVQVTVLVFDDVPDVGRLDLRQRPQVPGQPQRPFAGYQGVLELRLLIVGRRVPVPDLYLAGGRGRTTEA